MFRAEGAKRLVYEDVSWTMVIAGALVLLLMLAGLLDWKHSSFAGLAFMGAFGLVFATLRRRIQLDRASGQLRVFLALSLSPRLACVPVTRGHRCVLGELDAVVLKTLEGQNGPEFGILVSHKPVETLPGLYPRKDVLLALLGTHEAALERARGIAADLGLAVRDLTALGAIFD